MKRRHIFGGPIPIVMPRRGVEVSEADARAFEREISSEPTLRVVSPWLQDSGEPPGTHSVRASVLAGQTPDASPETLPVQVLNELTENACAALDEAIDAMVKLRRGINGLLGA